MTSPTKHPRRSSDRAVVLFGAMLGRTTLIYAIGMAAIVPFGIVSLAITTRYIPPAGYGQLTVLFAFTSGLSIICCAGSMHGTLMLVYGMAGDGDIAVHSDVPEAAHDDKRRLMGSGLLLVIAITAVLGGAAALAAPWWSSLLLHSRALAPAVRWACLSGATGALWRLVQQVFRFERRPVAFGVTAAIRPAIVVLFTVLALAAGMGISGVLAATAAGTAVSVLISLAATRRYYVFAPRRADVALLLSTGWPYVFVTVGFFAQTNADVFVLSQVVSTRALGLYSVASKIAQLPSYVSHAFLLAWPPLERSAVAKANKEIRGRAPFASTLLTYLMLITVASLVPVTLGASALIDVAAPAYRPAEHYIPFVCAAVVAYVFYYGLYRGCLFANRLTWIAFLATAAGVGYAALGIVFVHLIGVYGIMAAGTGAWLAAAAVVYVLNRRGHDPLPLQWRRLALIVLVAGLAITFQTTAPVPATSKVGLALVLGVAFVVALLRLRVIPAHQLAGLTAIAKALVSVRWSKPIARAVHDLPPHERTAVLELIAARVPLSDFNLASGTTPEVALARMVRGVRRVAQVGSPGLADHNIGAYLLADSPAFERSDQADHLSALGVDFLELHEIELAFARIRTVPRRRWSTADIHAYLPSLTAWDTRSALGRR